MKRPERACLIDPDIIDKVEFEEDPINRDFIKKRMKTFFSDKENGNAIFKLKSFNYPEHGEIKRLICNEKESKSFIHIKVYDSKKIPFDEFLFKFNKYIFEVYGFMLSKEFITGENKVEECLNGLIAIGSKEGMKELKDFIVEKPLEMFSVKEVNNGAN